MTNIVKFRSTPMFEERLCKPCHSKGDTEPYWPADRDFWPRVNGLLDFRMCKACRAEAVMRSAGRKAA
jgi:hypothetical protein